MTVLTLIAAAITGLCAAAAIVCARKAIFFATRSSRYRQEYLELRRAGTADYEEVLARHRRAHPEDYPA